MKFKNKAYLFFLLIISLNQINFTQQVSLDDFENSNGWNVFKSDGVNLTIVNDAGLKGTAIRFEYDFTKGTGYGGIQKFLPIDLPENYEFTFYLKAESPSNNFEIKFLDSTAQNVWWVNNRSYDFPKDWKKIKIKKRHIHFAWGPTIDQSLKRIDRIEFTIASAVGGKGTIWIDDLKFEELPPEDNSPIQPLIPASAGLGEAWVTKDAFDNNPETVWRSGKGESQHVVLDLQKRREVGGLVIDWDKEDYAKDFDIYIASDVNKNWEKVYSVKDARGYKSYIRLVEEDASFIKIELLNSSRENGYGIKEISVKNIDYSVDINQFFINIAKDNPRGYYPRYFNEEGTYWTLVGVNNDVKEALINEDGMVEVDKKSFSIEPFLFVDDKLVTWNDVKKEQSLEENYLPIPSVTWNYNDLLLETKAFAWGNENKYSVLYLSYSLTNNSSERKNGNLYLAIRPFQVNPYYQWLNMTGGSSEVSSIRFDGVVIINDDKKVIPITKEDGFGATKFDDGDITTFLSENKIPQSKSVTDERGFASGCLKYFFDLDRGETKTIYIGVPFYDNQDLPILPLPQTDTSKECFNKLLSATKSFCEEKLGHIKFNLPKSADKIINTWKSNLAYILINRDKAGIQPGSRSYERSWIRDGSLTSSALLKSGIVSEVKEFIDWYTAHQYENGKVPCVVDSRGPDPVPEHDSHGQLIYLIKEYFNFTKDTTFLRSKNENVLKAIEYIESLIAERSTKHFKNGNDSVRAYYGLVTESISHEGYSAKPMHSYWDNFFIMKGLKDAAEIQKILGKTESYNRIAKVRDTFKENLYNSINLAMKVRRIEYIPGCVELGDFDATSTTIALTPCNEFNNLPKPQVYNTFDKYYEFFENRRDNKIDWTAYTPYENRLIGSFIYLDEPERAHELIKFFLNDQRPQGWNHWAEVVWKDSRAPKFIGDMPHTWVGSDFINAIRSMFVYENEYDSSLVVGSALFQDWIDSPDGISIENLPTYYGELSYSIKKENDEYHFSIYGDVKLPKGGIKIKNFNGSKLPNKVIVNGKKIKDFSKKEISVKEFPAELVITYEN
ncbi:MAG: discoidin domain-containing protein [Ignavibacteriaceae bacterium]|nr:discoidin domain-containing protein [Ignavibacteriaceae bacterium]